jgi:HTH-type transcriptional regulator / antitoxin HigA
VHAKLLAVNIDQYKSPGQLIEALLAEKAWTQRVLAAVLQVSESSLNKIIAGKQAVSAEVALMLEEVFRVPAERFLGLQSDFDLAKARLVAHPDPERATRAFIFGELPISDMVKRGWLDAPDARDVQRVEAALLKFFGVQSLNDIEVMPHAAKKTDVAADTTPVQLAWLHRVRQLAAEMMVTGKFSPFGVRRAIEQLKLLTLSAEEVRKVPRILSEAGIRYVIVETLPNAKIDGVCFWLAGDAPVIAMTCRFDRIDNFWFVLRHELEHALQGHGRTQVVIDTDLMKEKAGTGTELAAEERVANIAAAEFCVPKKTMDSFIARKSPYFAERDLLGIAATLKVHPGLVAGQLRHRTGRHDIFGSHLAKIRSLVAPSAVVDGWGDIAPVGT